MRLTLRTLLAYLDDRLPPGQAKEIGQKVTTSPFATELAERIRSVVRRRRLGKEAAGQKSIDANLIAEYLDDQLTPELVALIERQILSSDAALAEVAATHQIIGTLKDPVELGDSLKERLYKLGPQPDAGEIAVESSSEDSGWKPLEAQAVRQERSPMLLLGAMTLGWLALVATDSNLFQGSPSPDAAETEPGEPGQNLANDNMAPDEPMADNLADSNPASTIPSAVANRSRPVAEAPEIAAKDTDTMPGTDRAILPETTEPDSKTAVAMSVESLPADTNAVADISDRPDSPEVVPVSLELVDSYAMAVRLADDGTQWTWVTSDIVGDNWANLLSNSVFGIPDPFDAQLSAPESGWLASVHGSTLFRMAEKGTALEIIDGQIVLQPLNIGKPQEMLTILCGGDSFQIAVPEQDKQIGISVRPLPAIPEDSPAETKSTSFLPIGQPCVMTVYAANTSAVVALGSEKIIIRNGMQLQWQSGTQSTPTPQAAVIPDWVFNVTKLKTESTTQLLAATATAFRTSKTVAGAAEILLEDRNPMIAEYSVNLPGLTKQLGTLCNALLETEDMAVRKAAISHLQHTQLTSPGARDRISEHLRTRLPETDTENAMKLLDGVTPVAAEERSVSAWLVDMLNNSRVSLRELAIYNLEQLTGTTENFIADDEPGRRANAVRRWTRILSRNGGRIIPRQQPAETAKP